MTEVRGDYDEVGPGGILYGDHGFDLYLECDVSFPEQACVFFCRGDVHVGLSDSRQSFKCFGSKTEEHIQSAESYLAEIRKNHDRLSVRTV